MGTLNDFIPIPTEHVLAAITDDGRTVADVTAGAITDIATPAHWLNVAANLLGYDPTDGNWDALATEGGDLRNLRIAIYDGAAGPADVAAAGPTLAEDAATFLKGMVALFAMGAADLDRLLAQGSDSDNIVAVATGLLRTAAYNYGYDGATWDRILAVAGAMVVTGPYEDEDAWVFGTSRVFPIGAVADDTAADSLGEDQVGIPRMTLTRILNTVASDPTTITQRQAVIAAADDLDETLARYATTLAAIYGFDGTSLQRARVTDQDTGGGTDFAQDIAIMVAAAAGGVQLGLIDDAAFTIATSAVVPIGAVGLDAGDSVDEGDVGVPRMTLTRVLMTSIADPTTPTQRAVVFAAGADGIDNGSDMLGTAAAGLRFNNTTWDRARGNNEVTALASAARAATTASAALTNYDSRGMAILLDVTAVGAPAGQINSIEVQALISATYRTIYQFAAINLAAIGQRAYLIYPGAASPGSWDSQPMQGNVPRNFRVQVTHNDANSITYAVTLSMLN